MKEIVQRLDKTGKQVLKEAGELQGEIDNYDLLFAIVKADSMLNDDACWEITQQLWLRMKKLQGDYRV